MSDVPLLTLNHEATECVYGVNISNQLDDYSFALAYDNAFYEFIPEKLCDRENPETLLAHEVSNNTSYYCYYSFMIVTTDIVSRLWTRLKFN